MAAALNGYATAIGSAYAPVYQKIAGADDAVWQESNIVVVGHSLGGGLAGFVGAIYGLSGALFDNMTFNSAASNAYSDSVGGDLFGLKSVVHGSQTPYPNDLSGLSAYAVSGEILAAQPGRANLRSRNLIYASSSF